jgi:RHS repeat-associated protein
LSSDAAWADYDKNGHLDIFVTVINGADNRLYRSYPPESKILQSGMSAKASASHHEAPAIVQSQLRVNRGSHRLLPLLPHGDQTHSFIGEGLDTNPFAVVGTFAATSPIAFVDSDESMSQINVANDEAFMRSVPSRQWRDSRRIRPEMEMQSALDAVPVASARSKSGMGSFQASSNNWSDGPVEPQSLDRGRAWVSPGSIGTPVTQGAVVTIAGEQARTALRVPDASWIERRSFDSFQEHTRQENDAQVERKEAVPKSGVVGNVDTYYVYDNDGNLVAEYDADGTCTSEYIYLGDVQFAEYRPQSDATYYYLSDQIRSTRLITDETGAVVYSAAHGPFGEEMMTWVATYDPKRKFSGKEREDYSGQDYFGARYYDHKSYRFNSVDPIINKANSLIDQQLWNLYSYCRNNPINFIDPDGREKKSIWQQFKEFVDRVRPQSNIVPDTVNINGKNMTTEKAIDKAVEMATDIEEGNFYKELLDDLIKATGKPIIKKPGTRYNKDGTPKSGEDQLAGVEQKRKILIKQRKQNYEKEIESNKQKTIDYIDKSKQNMKTGFKKRNKDDDV